MSQPPGPYGGQYGAPAPYGQPGPAQYGQPAGYGPPGGGYGPPGPGGYGPGGYGQPPQQKKSGALPWVIAALVVVLIGAGVLTFFLLKDDDDDSNTASTATPSISAQEMGSEEMSGAEVDPDIDLPTGAEVPVDDEPMEPPTSGGDTGEETIGGSVDLAAAWLVAVAQGDTATAWSLTDPSLQSAATDAAAGTDATPEEFLVGYFYSDVLQSEEPTDAQLVAVEYDSSTASDVVVIDVTLSGGGSVQVALFVNESLLVQDFGTL